MDLSIGHVLLSHDRTILAALYPLNKGDGSFLEHVQLQSFFNGDPVLISAIHPTESLALNYLLKLTFITDSTVKAV